MQDRIPTHAGRVVLTPVTGQLNTFDLVRADDPTQQGTPLNTLNLMSNTASATILTLAGVEPTNLSEAFIQLCKVLYPLKKNAVGIIADSYVGTGYSYHAGSGTVGNKTYGSLTDTLISIDALFTPLLIIIQKDDKPQLSGTDGAYVFLTPVEKAGSSVPSFHGVEFSWDEYNLTITHTTYKSPDSSGAVEYNCGLNDSGKTYNYIVIGEVPDTGVIPEDQIDWQAAVLALIDATLTLQDHAADAKATGDAIAAIEARLTAGGL